MIWRLKLMNNNNEKSPVISSMKEWLDVEFIKPVQELWQEISRFERNGSITGQSEIKRIIRLPLLPLNVDILFMHNIKKNYTLDMVGGLYNFVIAVIDFTSARLSSMLLFIQTGPNAGSCVVIDDRALAEKVSGVLFSNKGSIESKINIKDIDNRTIQELHSLFAEFALTEYSTNLDEIHLISIELFQEIRDILSKHRYYKDALPVSYLLETIGIFFKTWENKWLISFPVNNKFLNFSSKFVNAISKVEPSFINEILKKSFHGGPLAFVFQDGIGSIGIKFWMWKDELQMKLIPGPDVFKKFTSGSNDTVDSTIAR